MLQKGDLCYMLCRPAFQRQAWPRLAMYMHELPDAMIERYVIYVFSTGSIEYVTNVEAIEIVIAITITEL